MLKKNYLYLAALLILSALALSPALQGGFLFDDLPNIVTNTSIHIKSIDLNSLLYAAYSFEPGGSSRPLSMLSFSINYYFSGLNPFYFKLVNLTIHISTAFFIFILTKEILATQQENTLTTLYLPLLLSVLWAVHPLQVSSVFYTVQRMQLLVSFFSILSLLSYMHARQQQIHNKPSNKYWLLTILFITLGFSSKEDAILIPIYFLALELTILKFQAASNNTSRTLKSLYFVAFIIGLTIFLLYIIPKYWQLDQYSGRNFNSLERLLTQTRVLCMYLAQIIIPLPYFQTFFYDHLLVSTSLINPWSTLVSTTILTALLFSAWKFRKEVPIYSLGVLLYFSGHLITSNIIPLEIAFEHRNHFPIIGILLAGAGLASYLIQKTRPPKLLLIALGFVLLLPFCGTAFYRAAIWSDNLRLAQYSLQINPSSERAWVFLSSTLFENRMLNDNYLSSAIIISEKGTSALPNSVLLASNLVIFKEEAGMATNQDWEQLVFRIETNPVTTQSKGVLWALLSNAERGKYTDQEENIIKIIETFSRKTNFKTIENIRLGAYIHNNTNTPEKAFDFLLKATRNSKKSDPDITNMLFQLEKAGRSDWVRSLENHMRK